MAKRVKQPRQNRRGEALSAAVWMTQDTKARLRALARDQDQSMSWMVTQLIHKAYESRVRKGGAS